MRTAGYLAAFFLLVVSCGTNPYPSGGAGRIYHTSYPREPKHMDPAVSYYSYEAAIIDNIYETLYQYDYLRRPYLLVPALAETMPVVSPPGGGTRYEITIRRGVLYQDDPCFPFSGEYGGRTREVVAEDFVNAFRRIADPDVACPVRPVFLDAVDGMAAFFEAANAAGEADYGMPIAGVHAEDDHTLVIELTHPYPQIRYWLAMHFTAPMPREAIDFHGGELDRHPVGTGPFHLAEWSPRMRIILERNPRFREEFYPSEGEEGDLEAGLLEAAGSRLPLLDGIYFSYENEAIPRWRKFLQGWYDGSGISRETFDRVVMPDGALSPEMEDLGMRLSRTVEPSIYYLAFNMNDPVVGGLDERGRALRHAISLAFDVPSYLRIFYNGRMIPAFETIPPGIFGHTGDTSPWAGPDLERARGFLAEAGYPDGIDPGTGRPLTLTFDNAWNEATLRPNLLFIKERLGDIGINLELRTTDLNTFRTKVSEGNYQIIDSGWIADYPDPENFFFLLHSSQATIPNGGENRANYMNPAFDRLFEEMALMENSPERMEIIREMEGMVRRDSPWIPLFYSEAYTLTHDWVRNFKEGPILNNAWKYRDIDPEARERYREKEGAAVLWPLVLLIAAAAVAAAALIRRRRGA